MDDLTRIDKLKGSWALREGKEFVDAVKEHERAFFEEARVRGFLSVWIQAYCANYGLSRTSFRWETTDVQFDGEQGEFLRFCINFVRGYLRKQTTLAIGERPAFKCMASNSDSKSMVAASIGDTIVSYMDKRFAGGKKEWEAAEGAGLLGSSGLHFRWNDFGGDMVDVPYPVLDPDTQQPVVDEMSGQPLTTSVRERSGAPLSSVCYPWQVVREPRYSGEELWVLIREPDSVYNLAALFPHLRERIMIQDTSDEWDFERLFGSSALFTRSADRCIRKHFYHAPCAELPDGLHVIMFGDLELWRGPSPVKEGFPFAELKPGKFIETNFGYADAWSGFVIQQVLNQLNSDEFSNYATFGRTSVAMSEGTRVSVDDIATGGKAFFYPQSAKPPMPINFAEVPSSIVQAKDYLLKALDQVFGQNAAVRGDPDPNVRAAEMLSMLHTVAIEYQSYFQMDVDQFRERRANILLDMMKRFGNKPFLVQMVGVAAQPYTKTFTQEDLQGFERVVVETVSPIMQSIPGRVDFFMKTHGMPPKERAAAYELFTTGRPELFLQDDRSCQLLIRRENEDLVTGARPVLVSSTDNIFEHMPSHRASYDALRSADDPDQAALERHQKHMLEHQQAFYGIDPVMANALGIPLPPPIPGSPTWQLQMTMAGMGAPPVPGGPQGGQNAKPVGGGGAAGVAEEQPQKPEDPTAGVDQMDAPQAQA